MDYNKIIMYKIVCNDLSIPYTYVGHTTNFIKRKHKHKYSCITQTNQHYNYLLYQTIRENGGWNNWSMIEIEKYPCNDKNEALARERYWIESLKSTLNKVIPTRTYQEWREENKEHIAEYKKGHNEANKEHITEYHKEHYETNKEHLLKKQKKRYEANKEHILKAKKERYEANKEHLLKKQKERYEANKEIILKKKKERYEEMKKAKELADK